MVIRSDGSESPLLDDHQNSTQHEDKPKQLVKYGELVILGYNGFLPSGSGGRRRSKFVLHKRATPNGVKRSKHYVVNTPHSSQAILDSRQHSISYTLSRNQAIIVEYMPDEETDMFQIGRSSETPIDFVVMDTIPGDKAGDSKVMASTISRFACRILADRSNPRVARIYAAGFDSSRNIFLGEKATKWEEGREIDGLTTNGVLIMHPQGKFCGGDSEPGIWREVSVGGGIFTLRESRSAQVKGVAVEEVSNVLQDGTLIDLCGATLLWRSAEGLANSPTKEYLEKLVDQVNAGRPVCPVGLNTLVIPRKSTLDNEKQQPYVYLNCGHVQGHHDWGQEKDSNSRCCPMCLKLEWMSEQLKRMKEMKRDIYLFLKEAYWSHYEVYRLILSYLSAGRLIDFLLTKSGEGPLNDFPGLAYVLELAVEKKLQEIAYLSKSPIPEKKRCKFDDDKKARQWALNILSHSETVQGLQRLCELMFGMMAVSTRDILEYSIRSWDDMFIVPKMCCSRLEYLQIVIQADKWAHNLGVNAWRCFVAKIRPGVRTRFIDYDFIYSSQDKTTISVKHVDIRCDCDKTITNFD
ncbi:protein pellino isoform X4 [Homalodisca vitripennis]|uniref:protein pellino isoform X4 n=1 Tax=Homalodisca vitripennis TaxID=197043 RepID=UPI001EEBAA73|nr:protein pellino isoform X4 [Homalodisca vitripennis]